MNGMSASANLSASAGINVASLAKAVIINLDKGGLPIECLFNPKEYRFSKQASWNIGQTIGANVPQLQFGGGQPASLQMQLFFDTYARGIDVRRTHTDAIWALMLVDERLKDSRNQKGRPPRVRFHWGTTWSFDAVITSITQTFTLFLADGSPVRATLDVTFQQIKDEKLFSRQNPTSGGAGGERLWIVSEGDTLPLIAYRQYGDSSKWRLIAAHNRLEHVRRLKPGTVLELPNA
jgi:nucleoid-associated protein YgaU